jgi:hypothetical protein
MRLTLFHVPPLFSGNRGRKGSTASECNHSSFCKRIGPHSTDEPCDLVLKTLKRQHEIYAEKNSSFVQYEMLATAQFFVAKSAHDKKSLGDGDWQKARAGRCLCLTGKERFSTYLDSAQDYSKVQCDDGSGNYAIGRCGSEAPPRIVGDSQPCDCEERVSHEGPCTHTVRFDDMKFVFARWPERFHLQKTLGKSYSTPEDASAVSRSQGLPRLGVLNDKTNECYQSDDCGDNSVQHCPDIPCHDAGDENHDGKSARSGMRALELRDFRDLLNSIAFSAVKKENDWEIFGYLVKLKAYVDTGKVPNGTDSELSTIYLSQWTSSYGKDAMFQPQLPGNELGDPLERRDGEQLPQRPSTKRKKSSHERNTTTRTSANRNSTTTTTLANGKSRPKSCFFCTAEHTIASCSFTTNLGKRYKNKDEIRGLSRVLGDSTVMHIETMAQALTDEVGIGRVGANGPVWSGYGSIPLLARTVVLLRVFVDPSRPIVVQSRYRSAPQQPPNPKDNIVEVEFYDALGRKMQSDEQPSDLHPTFFYVQCVSEWLTAFTPTTKCLFSKLKPPQTPASSPYQYY